MRAAIASSSSFWICLLYTSLAPCARRSFFVIVDQRLRAERILTAPRKSIIFRQDLTKHRKLHALLFRFLPRELHILDEMLDIKAGRKISVEKLAAQQIKLVAARRAGRNRTQQSLLIE